VEQLGAVHVKVSDKRGSRGSVWRRWVCDPDDVDEGGNEGAERDGFAGEDSFALGLLDKML